MPVEKSDWKAVSQISDIRGTENLSYRKGEKILRCKVATLVRLMDIFGWLDQAQFSLSARLKTNQQILMTPISALPEEVTAASLVQLNTSSTGNIDSEEVDEDDLKVHSSVYKDDQDAEVVLFLSSPDVIAFSAIKSPLLPVCREAILLGDVPFVTFDSDLEEAISALQLQNVVVIRNYGVLIKGNSVEDLFLTLQFFTRAIQTQLSLVPFGLDNVILASEDTIQQIRKQNENNYFISEGNQSLKEPLSLAEVQFIGLARLLDNAGYNTGYESKEKRNKKSLRSLSTTEIGVHSLPLDGRKSALDRTFTPVSFLNESSSGLKSRASKWTVESGSLQKPRSISVRQQNLNQFAPQGMNPKEFKQKFREIRREYFTDTISAGPQSTVLEGVTWDEARKIKASGGGQSQIGDSLLMTAASRGIIQRDHQKEVLFYKNYTLNNPFDNITDQELQQYVSEVNRKKKE